MNGTLRPAPRTGEPPLLHALTADRARAEVWDDFRKDRDLIDRLRITPEELDALDKCALLGTLSSKQDLLFILRQIREATGSPSEPQSVAGLLSDAVSKRGESPDSGARKREIATDPGAAAAPLFSAMNGLLQRRYTEHLLVLISAIVAATGLVWALFAGLYALSQHLFAAAGSEFLDAPALPGFGTLGLEGGMQTLIAAEIVFVAIFVLAFSYDRWKAMRRLKSYRQRFSQEL